MAPYIFVTVTVMSRKHTVSISNETFTGFATCKHSFQTLVILQRHFEKQNYRKSLKVYSLFNICSELTKEYIQLAY